MNYVHSTNSTSVKIPGQCVSIFDDSGTLIDCGGMHSSCKISQKRPTTSSLEHQSLCGCESAAVYGIHPEEGWVHVPHL